MAAIISALTWVPRGAPKVTPTKYEPEAGELESVASELAGDMEGVEEEVPESKYNDLKDDEEEDAEDIVGEGDVEEEEEENGESTTTKSRKEDDDVLKEFDMDNYDDEDDYAFLGTNLKDFSRSKVGEGGEEDELEDLEDILVKPTDALLIAASSEEDFSHLDIYLYEEDEDNLYVHHDIILSAFPLCVEWLDYNPSSAEVKGSFVAVGTFQPDIEIWDLDVLDALQPTVILGGNTKSSSGKKTKRLSEGSHNGGVLCLSWNKQHRNVLASGSEDKTVKLWDVGQQKCLHTLSHHTDKAQAVQWNPAETSVLLTGSFDKTVAAFDVRAAEKMARWTLSADVECLAWNPHVPNTFLATTEDGVVTYHDAFKPGTTLFTLSAHTKPVSALSFNPALPGILATGSTDKLIKIWDISSGKPNLIQSFTSETGKVFSISFFKDSPYLLAVGGENNEMKIVNTLKFDSMRERFEAASVSTPAPSSSSLKKSSIKE